MSPRPSAGELLARVVAAAGLGYDAYAHLDLASAPPVRKQGLNLHAEATA